MSQTLFTSDPHFFHRNILRFQPHTRPYATIEEHNDALIKQWNSQVGPDDLVYELGDMFFTYSKRKMKEILDQLNGTIILILGNHDEREAMEKTGRFYAIHDSYHEVTIDEQLYVLCHYPIHEWRNIQHGAIHLYGHVHGRQLPDLPKGRSMDVGVDTHPQNGLYTIDDINRLMLPQPVRKHHD